mmetsp:Transcript_51873/g.168628  ORF Transcript_51873/g.168628 Transcript_51873/m.168628 type:complete len:200 (-) Transcript_51873:917-1516(-)
MNGFAEGLTLHRFARVPSNSRPALAMRSNSSDVTVEPAACSRLASKIRFPPSLLVENCSATKLTMLSSATTTCVPTGQASSMKRTCKSAPFTPCTTRLSHGVPERCAMSRPCAKSVSSCEQKIKHLLNASSGPSARSSAASVSCSTPFVLGRFRLGQPDGFPALPYVRTQSTHRSSFGKLLKTSRTWERAALSMEQTKG